MAKKKRARRLAPGEASFNALFRKYKRSAAKRSLIFRLTEERFRTLTKRPCFVCGAEPANLYRDKRASNGGYIYSGIDRMDNNVGYTRRNCVACCKHCNFAKGKGSLEELMLYIYDAYKFCIEPLLKKE